MNQNNDLRDFQETLKNTSLRELKIALAQQAQNLESDSELEIACGLMGMYFNKLQQEFGAQVTVYPIVLLPAPKHVLKKIGFHFAKITVRNLGHLKKYQEDASLVYTNFQPMTEAQWEQIRENKGSELMMYEMNIVEKDNFAIDLSLEYKAIINRKLLERREGLQELHAMLREFSKNEAKGCRSLFFFLLLTFLVVIGLPSLLFVIF